MTNYEQVALDISIVVPLFNEDESLMKLESWIRSVMEEHNFSYEIIMIDDGSTDHSWEVVTQLNEVNPAVKGIRFRRNYGKSAALNTAFASCNGRVVITMDADLQDSPDEIPELYRMIIEEKYDIVSGWKKKRFDSFIKNNTSKVYNQVARWVTGVKLNDMNCGLKAYKKEVVKSIEVYGEMHRYIPAIARWAGFRKIGEKVVQHRAREFGVSKFGIERFLNGFLDLMSITFVGKFGKKPMHFLGTLGAINFSIGFIILIYLSILKLFFDVAKISDRPLFFVGILTIIVGTQLFIGGFLAELISRSSPHRNQYLERERLGLNLDLQNQ